MGILFIFTYTLCSKFLIFTLHYVPIKVLFDLKEGIVWILTWLINVCGVIFLVFGVIFLVFGILSWDYKCPLFCFTILHLIYMWDISLCSTLFCSHMLESVTTFSEWFYLLSVNNYEIWVEAKLWIEIQAMFYLKTKVVFVLAKLFTHWVLMACGISLVVVSVLTFD